MSIIEFTYKEYKNALEFLQSCSDDEITTLEEGGVITIDEGCSVYEAEFDGTDEELIADVLELRVKKYTLQFIDNKDGGYFIVGRL
jgi:hypothetical protein